MTARHHLVQLNIGRMRYPLDHPAMTGFLEALDPVNELADQAPGFVWRLITTDEDTTLIRPLPDPELLVNLSVWESVEALKTFTYRTDHVVPFRRRAEWFEPHGEPHLVMWWVPAGHHPTVDEAMDRLELLRANGPTADAFTFATPFPPPDTAVADQPATPASAT
jgi:hypothetical protein